MLKDFHKKAEALGDSIRFSYGSGNFPSQEFLMGLAYYHATGLVEEFEGEEVIANNGGLRVVATGIKWSS